MTLLGLWLMPAIFSIQLHFWRFMAVWAFFTVTTGYVLSLCIRKKTLASTTPRKVRPQSPSLASYCMPQVEAAGALWPCGWAGGTPATLATRRTVHCRVPPALPGK